MNKYCSLSSWLRKQWKFKVVKFWKSGIHFLIKEPLTDDSMFLFTVSINTCCTLPCNRGCVPPWLGQHGNPASWQRFLQIKSSINTFCSIGNHTVLPATPSFAQMWVTKPRPWTPRRQSPQAVFGSAESCTACPGDAPHCLDWPSPFSLRSQCHPAPSTKTISD